MPQPVPPSQFSALVVDADPRVRHLLKQQLVRAGYRVDAAGHGEQALAYARAAGYDVILFDLDLPGLDGLSICRAIRMGGPNRGTPVVLLSGRGDEADTVLGLESGADDYVVKPFGVREVLARVAAIVRRRVWAGAQTARPGLVLDRHRRRILLDGRLMPATRQEFDLLSHLAARAGTVVTRAALVSNVWPGDARVTVRTVDAVVCRLRRKIEPNPRRPERLVTQWGVGYTLMEPASAPIAEVTAVRSLEHARL